MSMLGVGVTAGPRVFSLSVALVLLALSGCGRAGERRVAREAAELRLRVPGMLATNQRRALLYAVAAQKLDPTIAGNWLLQSVDSSFRGVARAFTLSGQSTITALRTSTTVLTSDAAGQLKTWDPSSGHMLGVAQSKAPIVRLASSSSPYLVASVNKAGELAMWNLEDARHPVELPVHGAEIAGRQVLALGFAARSTQLLALTPAGKLYVFDVLARTRIAVRSLGAVRDLARSTARGLSTVSAAGIVAEQYSPKTTMLVASPGDGLVRIDFSSFSGHVEIPASEITGRVTAIAEYSGASHIVVLGTSAGTVVWNSKDRIAATERTGPSVGLALQGSTFIAANAQGLASIEASAIEAGGGAPSTYSGRPARALLAGPGGPLEIGQDGSISLVRAQETGFNLETTSGEASLIAQFGPEGNLLETSGADANHIESLVAVQPGVAGQSDPEAEPNRVVRRYLPSKSWWPTESTGASGAPGLFVDDAELGERYVVAGGQDPTGTAVVLVWDAKTGAPLRRLTLTTGGISSQSLTTSSQSSTTAKPSLVSQVTVLPKRHLIAAYSALQELIVLWSTDTWQRVTTIDVGPIGSFSVSSDEATLLVDSLSDKQSELAAGNASTRLMFYSVASGKLEHQVLSEGTRLAAYMPQGQILAVQKGGTLRQLSPDGHERVALPITIESGEPSSLAWNPRSKVLAVGLPSDEVRLVDLATGEVSDPLPAAPGMEPVDLSFSPDGRLLAASDGMTVSGGHAQAPPSIWELDDESLERRACAVAGGGATRAEWSRWTSSPFLSLCGSATR